MKKIEKKIKNSIQTPNLSFFDQLPKSIVSQKKIGYIFPILATAVFLFTFMIYRNTYENQKLYDNTVILMNNVDILKEENNSKLSFEIQDRIWNDKKTSIEEVNLHYDIHMKKQNLISSIYQTDIKDDTLVIQTILQYQINNKDIMVHISDNITSWNVDYGGMPNYMQKCGKSIIQNKQIILAKSYREYYKFESDIELFSSKTSYFALYEKDDLYYFVTTSDISQKEFIQFLKEYII